MAIPYKPYPPAPGVVPPPTTPLPPIPGSPHQNLPSLLAALQGGQPGAVNAYFTDLVRRRREARGLKPFAARPAQMPPYTTGDDHAPLPGAPVAPAAPGFPQPGTTMPMNEQDLYPLLTGLLKGGGKNIGGGFGGGGYGGGSGYGGGGMTIQPYPGPVGRI